MVTTYRYSKAKKLYLRHLRNWGKHMTVTGEVGLNTSCSKVSVFFKFKSLPNAIDDTYWANEGLAHPAFHSLLNTSLFP